MLENLCNNMKKEEHMASADYGIRGVSNEIIHKNQLCFLVFKCQKKPQQSTLLENINKISKKEDYYLS